MKRTAPTATTKLAVLLFTTRFHPTDVSSIRITKPGNMNPMSVDAALPTCSQGWI